MEPDTTRLRPPGTLTTIVAGFVGGAVGFIVGFPIANLLIPDDAGLEGLGVFVIVSLLSICGAAGLGVGIGLALTKNERAWVTGVVLVPAALAAIILMVVLVGSLDPVLALTLLATGSAITLWLVRVLVMAPRSRQTVREG